MPAPTLGLGWRSGVATQLDVYAVSLEVIRSVRPVVVAIGRRDKDLEKQARRAASSVALNIKEGARRRGSDRRYHFTVAAGSADEVRGCLEVAEAWGHMEADAIAGCWGSSIACSRCCTGFVRSRFRVRVRVPEPCP